MITALCRTVILYFLIMIGLRLMGKRQIGELEPSELVLTMMISDLGFLFYGFYQSLTYKEVKKVGVRTIFFHL